MYNNLNLEKMDSSYLTPVGILDASVSPITAMCFMLRGHFTYLVGGSCHGSFWIYDLAARTKVNQMELNYPVTSIHYHPTPYYEIITHELLGKITFWGFTANFEFVVYHTVFSDVHPSLSVLTFNHSILYPHQYRIRILDLNEIKCTAPVTPSLCEIVDGEYGRHTTLVGMKVHNQYYLVSGYSSGSIIIREFILDGLTTRLSLVRPTSICSMVYNENKQELIISDENSISLGVMFISINTECRLVVQMRREIFVGGGRSILQLDCSSTYLLCGRQHGTMKFFNLRSSECIPISPEQLDNSIEAIISSPTMVNGWGDYIFAIAYSEGILTLWTFNNFVLH